MAFGTSSGEVEVIKLDPFRSDLSTSLADRASFPTKIIALLLLGKLVVHVGEDRILRVTSFPLLQSLRSFPLSEYSSEIPIDPILRRCYGSGAIFGVTSVGVSTLQVYVSSEVGLREFQLLHNDDTKEYPVIINNFSLQYLNDSSIVVYVVGGGSFNENSKSLFRGLVNLGEIDVDITSISLELIEEYEGIVVSSTFSSTHVAVMTHQSIEVSRIIGENHEEITSILTCALMVSRSSFNDFQISFCHVKVTKEIIEEGFVGSAIQEHVKLVLYRPNPTIILEIPISVVDIQHELVKEA